MQLNLIVYIINLKKIEVLSYDVTSRECLSKTATSDNNVIGNVF